MYVLRVALVIAVGVGAFCLIPITGISVADEDIRARKKRTGILTEIEVDRYETKFFVPVGIFWPRTLGAWLHWRGHFVFVLPQKRASFQVFANGGRETLE